MIAERYLQRFLEHLEWGNAEGATRLRGDGRITSRAPYPGFQGDPEAGWFVSPTLWDDVGVETRLFQEEIFGPTVNLVRARDLSHALELANAHPYGLSSAIFTQDPRAMLEFKETIQAGMSSINNSTTGAEAHLPFGGMKASGNGTRESGIWVLDSYTRWHAVNVDLATHVQLAQMDVNYGQSKADVSLRAWTEAG